MQRIRDGDPSVRWKPTATEYTALESDPKHFGYELEKLDPSAISPEEFLKVNQPAKRTTDPGPSQQRPYHVKQAVRARVAGADIATNKATHSNRISDGDIPPILGQVFSLQEGSILHKDATCSATNIRPLAAASQKRREVGSVIANHHSNHLREFTQPLGQQGYTTDGHLVACKVQQHWRKEELVEAEHCELDQEVVYAMTRVQEAKDEFAHWRHNNPDAPDTEAEHLTSAITHLTEICTSLKTAAKLARSELNLPDKTPSEMLSDHMSDNLKRELAIRRAEQTETLKKMPRGTPRWKVPLRPLEPGPLRNEARFLLKRKRMLKLDDCKNAFGLIRRRWTLLLIMAVTPQMVAAFMTLYGDESLVMTARGVALHLSTGGAQGDGFTNPSVAHPLAFSAITLLMCECAVMQYWDDTASRGTVENVAKAERYITSSEDMTGIVLKPPKCHAHVADQLTADLVQVSALFERTDARGKVRPHTEWTRIHAGFNMDYLKMYIGCDSYTKRMFQTKKLPELTAEINVIVEYGLSSTDRRARAYKAIRYCLSDPKVHHVARLYPPPVAIPALLGQFDHVVRRAVETLCDGPADCWYDPCDSAVSHMLEIDPPPSLDNSNTPIAAGLPGVWENIRTSTCFGGWGIRTGLGSCGASFLTACVLSHEMVKRYAPSYNMINDAKLALPWFTHILGFSVALDALIQCHFPAECSPQVKAQQKENHIVNMVESHRAASARDRMNFRCLRSAVARAHLRENDASWLDTHFFPHDNPDKSTLLCDGAWILSTQMMTGLAVTPTDEPCLFCHKKDAKRYLDDRFGDHLTICKAFGWINAVHNAVADATCDAARSVGIKATREPSYKCADSERRADILFEPDPFCKFQAGRPLFSDVVCASISAPSNSDLIMKHGRGAAAAAHERGKVKKLPHDRDMYPNFTPYGCETTPGGLSLGPDAFKLVCRLEELHRKRTGRAKSRWTRDEPRLLIRLQLICERFRYAAHLERLAQRQLIDTPSEAAIIRTNARISRSIEEICKQNPPKYDRTAWLSTPQAERSPHMSAPASASADTKPVRTARLMVGHLQARAARDQFTTGELKLDLVPPLFFEPGCCAGCCARLFSKPVRVCAMLCTGTPRCCACVSEQKTFNALAVFLCCLRC